MATTINGIPLDPGTRLVVDEDDYLYGTGRVAVIVSEVLGIVDQDGEQWVELRSDEILIGGTRTPRTVTIRISALRAAKLRGLRR